MDDDFDDFFFLCPTENAGQLENCVAVFMLFGAWFLFRYITFNQLHSAGGMGAPWRGPLLWCCRSAPQGTQGSYIRHRQSSFIRSVEGGSW